MEHRKFRSHLKQIIDIKENLLGDNIQENTDLEPKNSEKKSDKNLENLSPEERDNLEDLDELGAVLNNLSTH